MNAERRRFLSWTIVGAIVMVASACSPPAVQETVSVTSDVAPTEPAPTEPAPTAEPTATVEPTHPPKLLVDVPSVQEIALTTPQEGAGIKPQFTWEPLDGAARYTLVLYTAALEPYWAWGGTATSVYLGGSAAAPRDDSAGPVLGPGMSWAVMAFDGDDQLIGSSVLRPISP
jgi:hypothetical protein